MYIILIKKLPAVIQQLNLVCMCFAILLIQFICDCYVKQYWFFFSMNHSFTDYSSSLYVTVVILFNNWFFYFYWQLLPLPSILITISIDNCVWGGVGATLFGNFIVLASALVQGIVLNSKSCRVNVWQDWNWTMEY